MGKMGTTTVAAIIGAEEDVEVADGVDDDEDEEEHGRAREADAVLALGAERLGDLRGADVRTVPRRAGCLSMVHR